MKTATESGYARTFFNFGMSVYITSFLILMHYYRISKEVFRDDFGPFKWSFKGNDFSGPYGTASVMLKGEPTNLLYPPWVGVSYLPLAAFDFNSAYVLFSYILIAVLFFTIFFCLRENKIFTSRQMSLLIALLCTSLFYHTYPVLFAIERGNADLLAGFFSAAGLFALSRNFRKTAVTLLVLATQYKIYPAILGSILFIRYGWKTLALFIVFNVLMLLIHGYQHFRYFLRHLWGFIQDPFRWMGNHSLASFAHEMVRLGFLPENLQGVVELTSSIVVILIFVIAFLWIFARRKPRSSSTFSVAEAGLIGMAFQLMSLLPNTGHDYKLPIQIVPFLLMISRDKADFAFSKRLHYFLIFVLSVSVAFLFLPLFLIKTFGIITSFVIYVIFAFFKNVKEDLKQPP